jgi:hypothetical protein
MTTFLMTRRFLALAAFGCLAWMAWAQSATVSNPVLFLAIGQRGATGPESYVIPMSDPARIAEARQYLADKADGRETRPLVATCTVQTGADGQNRNYSVPGTPLWGWQVTGVVRLERYTRPDVEAAVVVPARDSAPSDIAALLAGDPAKLPGNLIGLRDYPVAMELKPDDKPVFANFSNRGFVGPGSQVLITGFIIEGGAPRNLVLRVLGPSLVAYGVANVLTNPRVEIYRGPEKIAENDDWNQGNLNRSHLSSVPPPAPFNLVPADPREPALQLSLPPGTYTVIVSSADSSSGVALAEFYAL